MGQSQSGVISVDEFSNRVMGAAVVLLSSQLDTALTFKSVDQIQPTDTHVLPLLTEAPETNPSIEKLVALYSDYYSEEKRELVNKYITEHIIDNETHVNAFISLLINSLRKKPAVSSYYSKPLQSKQQTDDQRSKAAASLQSKQQTDDQRSKAAASLQSKQQKDDQRSKPAASLQSKQQTDDQRSKPVASLQSKPAASIQSKQQIMDDQRSKPAAASLRSQPMPQQEFVLEEGHRSIRIPEELIPEEHRSVKQAQESVRSKLDVNSEHPSVRIPILKSVPLSPVHNGILDTLDAPVDSEHTVSRVTSLQPVKGSNKLQKRIHAIDQAIDAERLASDRLSQIKQNIEASYSEEENISAMLEEEFGGGASSDFEHV